MDKQQIQEADPEIGYKFVTNQIDHQPVGVINKISSVCCQVLTKFLECSGFTTGLIMTILLYSLGLVIGIAVIIPLLVLILIAARVAQFKLNGEDNVHIKEVKFWARFCLSVICFCFLAITGVVYICKIISSLYMHKHKHWLRITFDKHSAFHTSNWVAISCKICVLELFSFFLIYLQTRRSAVLGMNSASQEAVTEIVDCVMFWWAQDVFLRSVPALQRQKLLGLQVQKWIDQSVFVFVGFNIITVFTHSVVGLMKRWLARNRNHPERVKRHWWSPLTDNVLPERYLLYYAHGLRTNIHFLLTSLLLLLTWILYFGSKLSTTPWTRSVVIFVAWTFFSLVVFSFLCLLKDVVLLTWEAREIYIRLSSRIVQAGEQLYFLGIISRRDCDILNILYNEEQELSIYSNQLISADDGLDEWESVSDPDSRRKLSQVKRHKLRYDLLIPKDHTPTIYEILQVAQSFLASKDVLSNDMHVPFILRNLNNPRHFNECSDLKKNLRLLIDGESTSSKDFELLLEHANFSEQPSSVELESWMEKSHMQCSLIGNILSNAKEVVECLNKIISSLLIAGVFIMWLILTGLTSTRVLVLIASPVLAATFIFGDTCKSLFQGIMFVYVVHPFDVGDLCVIDGKFMEVKLIGVWKTTFSIVDKLGGQEEVIFPNQELANRVVINHKSEFDCEDYIEVNIDLEDDETIGKFIRQIEQHLNSDTNMFTIGSHSVAMLTAEDNMKIAVRFVHKIKLIDATYFECLRIKVKRRTALILYVQNLVKKLTVASVEQARDKTVTSDDLPTSMMEISPDQISALK